MERVRMSGPKRDGSPEKLDCLFEIPAFPDDAAHVVERVGVVRSERQRLGKAHLSFVETAQSLENVAAIFVQVRVLRRKLDRPCQKLEGFGVVAVVVLGDSQKVKRVDVVRGASQDATVNRCRLIETALLMQPNGPLDRVPRRAVRIELTHPGRA
jgi:hypothetical protein